jgi:hypothetical protein
MKLSNYEPTSNKWSVVSIKSTGTGQLRIVRDNQTGRLLRPLIEIEGKWYEYGTMPTSYLNYFDFASESVTTITTQDTWVKLNTNTTSVFADNGLAHSNNRITNIGVDAIYKLEGIGSLAAGNNNEVHLAFFKNGVLWPCSEQESVMSAAGRMNAIPFQCLIHLDVDDYVEVWVKNKNATTNITLDNINVIATKL